MPLALFRRDFFETGVSSASSGPLLRRFLRPLPPSDSGAEASSWISWTSKAAGFGEESSGGASGARVKNGWSFLADGPSVSGWTIVETSTGPIGAVGGRRGQGVRVVICIGVRLQWKSQKAAARRFGGTTQIRQCVQSEGESTSHEVRFEVVHPTRFTTALRRASDASLQHAHSTSGLAAQPHFLAPTPPRILVRAAR